MDGESQTLAFATRDRRLRIGTYLCADMNKVNKSMLKKPVIRFLSDKNNHLHKNGRNVTRRCITNLDHRLSNAEIFVYGFNQRKSEYNRAV